jgi:hypothetical protein
VWLVAAAAMFTSCTPVVLCERENRTSQRDQWLVVSHRGIPSGGLLIEKPVEIMFRTLSTPAYELQDTMFHLSFTQICLQA